MEIGRMEVDDHSIEVNPTAATKTTGPITKAPQALQEDDTNERPVVLSIRYGSQAVALEAAPSDSVSGVKLRLASDLGLDLASMKLIQKGKVLHNDEAISKLVDKAANTDVRPIKLTLVGTKKEDIIEVGDDITTATAAATTKPRKYAVNITALNAQRAARDGQMTPCRFGAVETLSGLPHEDRARQILESLAQDPAILHVMAKHRWSVGTLCEMYPEGMVGVSEVCVLGLNTNHGQRISLRIRTDDLKGFRKMLSIRKVLYHELAHNVHSEHGDEFYMLMRQIEREADAYGGTGRVLDPSFERYERINTVDDTICHEINSRPHTLGGESRDLSRDLRPVDLVRLAAAQRFDDISTTPSAQGSQPAERDHETVVVPKDQSTAGGVMDVDDNNEVLPSEPPSTAIYVAENLATAPGSATSQSSSVLPSPSMPVSEPPVLSAPLVSTESSLQAVKAVSDALHGAIDEAICLAIDADSPSIIEVLQRISDVFVDVSSAMTEYVNRERVDSSVIQSLVVEALDFLHAIITNAQKPEEKFKRINVTNAKFQRLVAALKLDGLLRIVGFQPQPSDVTTSRTTSTNAATSTQHLVLTRSDHAVVYVTLGVLSQEKEAVQNMII